MKYYFFNTSYHKEIKVSKTLASFLVFTILGISSLAVPESVHAAEIDDWTALPSGDDNTGIKFGTAAVYGLASGAGKIVAVGSSGKASYSEDGINWTALTPGADTGIKFTGSIVRSIVYGNGKFVAVGSNGKAAYSEDGINWTYLTPGDDSGIKFGSAVNTDLISIAYGNGKFVVVGSSGRASYSEDGINWTALTPGADTGVKFGTTSDVISVAYGNGKFVAVGEDGKASYSEDGINWTALTSGSDVAGIKFGVHDAYVVAYGNGKFITAGQSGKAAYSEDGINWTYLTPGDDTGIKFGGTGPRAITYGNGKFIAAGQNGKAAYSEDGINWTALPAGTRSGIWFGTSQFAYALLYYNEKFIVAGGGGQASYTAETSPSDPTIETVPATSIDASSATLNGSLDSLGDEDFVDVYFEYWRKTDTTSPTFLSDTVTLASSDSFSFDITDLDSETTYEFRAVVVVDTLTGPKTLHGARLELTTTPAFDWTVLTPGADTGVKFGANAVYDIAYGNGKFVAVGQNGKASYSEDGINWTELPAGADTGIKFTTTIATSVAYGNGKFVVVGSSGRAAYSEDGINWTYLTPSAATGIKFGSTNAMKVAYGNGKFVVVGFSGKASYSEDGINWTALTGGSDVAGIKFGASTARAIIYGNDKFVVSGDSSKASYSEDGINWTALTGGSDTEGIKFGATNNQILSIAYGNGKFVATGSSGKASYSTDGINWTALPPGIDTGIKFSTSNGSGVFYGEGIFIVTGGGGKASYSEDGISWLALPPGDATGIKFGSSAAVSLAYGNGKFVAVGNSGKASYTLFSGSSFEAPEITTSAASSVADVTATLNGELTSIGDADSVGVYFEYGIGDFANSTTPEELTETGVFSFDVSSLTPETEYQFRAVVEYEDGGTQTVTGSTLTFTTEAAPTAPDAPTSLEVATESSTEISLLWNAPLQDGGSAITGYQIERSADGIGGWSQIGTTNAVTTVYEDGGLTSSTEYFYRVIAVNAVGSSSPSNTDSATTDAEAPTADTELATSVTDTTATLNASIDLKDYGSANAYFEYGIGGFISITMSRGVNASGSFTEDITGLTDDSLYQVRLVIEYENGGTQIVYGDTETFTTDETIVPVFPPDAPTGLTATAESTTEISLLWSAPVDDGGATITEYSIERSLTGVDAWSEIATPSTTNYSDTGLTSNTEYFYRVSAINSEGVGDPSSAANATTEAVPPSVTTDAASAVEETTVTLNATLNLEDYTEADVYFEYGTVSFSQSTTPETLSSSGVFSENIVGLSSNTSYQFRAVIEYENGGTQIVYGDTETFTTDATPQPATEPGSPTGLIATEESATHINLTWTAPADDGGATITEYRVDRSPSGLGSWTQIGTTDGSTREYDDNGLSASTEYFYRVKAVNSEGASVASNVASAITDAEDTTPTPEPEESDPEDLRVYNVNSEVGEDWIKITWKTNREADSRVRYGTDQDLKEEKEETGNREKHSLTLRNLSPGTPYYFRASSEDRDGDDDRSRIYSVTTAQYVNTGVNNLTTVPLVQTTSLPQYEDVKVETNQSEEEKTLLDNLSESSPSQTFDFFETQAYEKEGLQYINEVKFQIVDEQGKPLSYHPVALHSEPRTTITDENGIATFTNVPTGDHHLIFAYQDREIKKGINIANVEDVNAPLRSQITVVSVVKDPLPAWVWLSLAVFSVVTIFLLLTLYRQRTIIRKGEQKRED